MLKERGPGFLRICHDDVGASLSRISILSDLAKNKDDVTGGPNNGFPKSAIPLGASWKR